MSNWYVLHVLTGKEIDVKKVLLRDLSKQNILVPQKTIKERKDGQWHMATKTLFPGYVFVKVFMDAEMYYRLDGIPSVIRILGDVNGPKPVLDDEMYIVLRLSGDGEPLGISRIYCEGSKVKVSSGPLVGLEGQIVKVDARRYRAKVNLTLMGEPRIVEMGIELLSKESL